MPAFIKVQKKYYPLLIFIAAISAIAVLPSCNTIIGKAYENTTGRYNSYFLAKEKMKEVDVALKAKMKDDYHKILSIHYPSDSNFGKSQNAALEEVFKYASWSVRWHKRSKWADNCYILIGKVRQYQANYKDGLETFKYVNATSPSVKDRHEALIQLMKFFTDFGEYDNVKYVIDFMDKEPEMTKKNRRDYLIAKASFFQHYEDYKKVHELLDTVLPSCRRRHDKARLRFINGQVCEYLKEASEETQKPLDFDADAAAYKNYKITLKSNPKYELWFNARLNMMRVAKHSDLKDVDKARKYFKKMLADQKNTEFKDRIYYEWASFERKNKEYPKAEDNYKKSIKNANNNQRQKAYSYLALGQMYYEDQQQFENAKLYYDSAIAILPKDHKGYGKIFRRQRILKDFVEHLNTVKREDSLQRLAKMDTAELSKFLDDYITREEKRLNDEAQRLAKLAKKNAQASQAQSPFNNDFSANNPAAAPNSPGVMPGGFNIGQQTAQFYFYNQAMVAQGRAEFQQKWGRRKLEDFWRISAKESDPDAPQANNPNDTSKVSSQAKADGKVKGLKDKEEEEEVEAIKINKSDLYNTIPSTPEKLKASHGKLQVSLFKLGKIYNQHLNEPRNSIKSLERLINEYPDNENVPEAHYMIYLISKGNDSSLMEVHKNILLQKYPHTIYAKIIQNPNYLAESKMMNKQIMARYKVAYEQYLIKNYKDADSLFTLIQTDYPDSEFDPQIDLIKAIMKARSGKREDYRQELQSYVDQYKAGKYHDYAQTLIDRFDGKKPKEQGQPKDSVQSTPQPQVAPPTDNPAPNPAFDAPDGMPEEIKKMYEEQMRNRSKGAMQLAPGTNTSPDPNQIPVQEQPIQRNEGSSPNIPPSPQQEPGQLNIPSPQMPPERSEPTMMQPAPNVAPSPQAPSPAPEQQQQMLENKKGF